MSRLWASVGSEEERTRDEEERGRWDDRSQKRKKTRLYASGACSGAIAHSALDSTLRHCTDIRE